MKIALAQTTATSNLESNLKKMEDWVREAKEKGAELILFPEMAYYSGREEDWKAVGPRYDVLLGNFCAWARTYHIALIPGTLREPSKDPTRYFNTLPMIDAKGKILTEYRKIFLYKANLADRSYDETKSSTPGSELKTIHWNNLNLGFSICFDLRFPEVFRGLKKRGAQIVFLPSAFTVSTGKAHWETLIRARAIENQFFVIAPGLVGKSGDGSDKYGHSLVVDPWGEVLLKSGEAEELKMVDFSVEAISTAEQKVNAWGCRREDLFPIA